MHHDVNRPALEPRPQFTRREVRIARPATHLAMWREGDRFGIELRTASGADGHDVVLRACVPVPRAMVLDRGVAFVDGKGASTVVPMTRAELQHATYLLAADEG